MRTSVPVWFFGLALIALALLLAVACQPAVTSTPLSPEASRMTPRVPVSATVPVLATASLPTATAAVETATGLPALTPSQLALPGVDAERMVAAANSHLAQHLGLPEEDIALKDVDEVQWRDSSLGYPQTGMIYLQVITPGFPIVLTVDDEEYKGHTDTQGSVVLCKEASVAGVPAIPDPVEPGLGTVEAGLGGFVNRPHSPNQRYPYRPRAIL
jgi:hypothetical protein